jgi:hypothetical protein
VVVDHHVDVFEAGLLGEAPAFGLLAGQALTGAVAENAMTGAAL